MSAVKDGDSWILNGEKVFITNGNEADFTMVFAVTDPAKGARDGVTCFLVDREMGWTSSYIPTMGDWGPASLYFENVRDVRIRHDERATGGGGRGDAQVGGSDIDVAEITELVLTVFDKAT